MCVPLSLALEAMRMATMMDVTTAMIPAMAETMTTMDVTTIATLAMVEMMKILNMNQPLLLLPL